MQLVYLMIRGAVLHDDRIALADTLRVNFCRSPCYLPLILTGLCRRSPEARNIRNCVGCGHGQVLHYQCRGLE